MLSILYFHLDIENRLTSKGDAPLIPKSIIRIRTVYKKNVRKKTQNLKKTHEKNKKTTQNKLNEYKHEKS